MKYFYKFESISLNHTHDYYCTSSTRKNYNNVFRVKI